MLSLLPAAEAASKPASAGFKRDKAKFEGGAAGSAIVRKCVTTLNHYGIIIVKICNELDRIYCGLIDMWLSILNDENRETCDETLNGRR